jgi:uncharacterized membrane-anchored protein
MRNSFKRASIVVATLAVLIAVNGSIVAKERIKANGAVILLALAPVDPRSLMQGDYMALRFEIADALPTETSGSVALLVDANGVATVNPDHNAAGLHLRYRIRNGRPWIGTNAYFFEAGSASRFQGARFGEFRVDRETGEAVLVGLKP